MTSPMTSPMTPASVRVTFLEGGKYRLSVNYEIQSEHLGAALAEFGPGVAVTFTHDPMSQANESRASIEGKADSANGAHGAHAAANGASSTVDVLSLPLSENEIEYDARKRMKLEPFLRAIAKRGGLEWTDRVGVATVAAKMGWQTRHELQPSTAAKVLTRLIDEEPGVSWIQRRGSQRSRQYRILPLSESERRTQ